MEHLFDKEVRLGNFVKFVTPSVIMLVVIGLYYFRLEFCRFGRAGISVYRISDPGNCLGCFGHAGRRLQRGGGH